MPVLLLNVSPCAPMDYAVHGGVSNTKSSGDRIDTFAFVKHASSLLDGIIRHFCISIACPAKPTVIVSVFVYHIAGIGFGVTKKQMGWINTRWIVARMANIKRLIKISISLPVVVAMGICFLAIKSQNSIPMCGFRLLPNPTSSLLIEQALDRRQRFVSRNPFLRLALDPSSIYSVSGCYRGFFAASTMAISILDCGLFGWWGWRKIDIHMMKVYHYLYVCANDGAGLAYSALTV